MLTYNATTSVLTNIGDMWRCLADRAVLLDLPGEAAPEVHGAGPGLVGLEPQHAGAGQLVVSRSAAGLLLNLHYVDRVPATLYLLGPAVTSLLDKNYT